MFEKINHESVGHHPTLVLHSGQQAELGLMQAGCLLRAFETAAQHFQSEGNIPQLPHLVDFELRELGIFTQGTRLRMSADT